MSDARWMRSALNRARRSLGRTWPNPAVGAVIVHAGRMLGAGQTAPGGRPHAEIVAMEAARTRYGADSLTGSTAYVTLEPCAHHGKTPPCADALVAAGIARVVCPIEDPDPRVSGRGFDTLRKGGVEVTIGEMAAEARAMNAGFLSLIERRRPHLVLKLATTLDGRIATRTGESRWITGPEARRRVHLMRAEADAVLIGAGTARVDDPMLDVRDLGLLHAAPVRIVADGGASLPLTGRLAQSAEAHPVWVLHRTNADPGRIAAMRDLGIETLACETTATGELDMHAALGSLGARGITRVLCEGGGRLAASLLAARLVDELVHFTAPRAIGGDGTPAVQALGLDRLAEAPGFERVSVEPIGADVMVRYRLPA
ncbi:MAG: bifunctional diaminohydroxyphosphoribosylaminopyrimidine deaminase/5-amino-6-(5-phosphoribosylamino)uracil reductase RibD [Pseudomonadota bacterium]